MGETSETRYKPRACCRTATRAAQRDNSICRAIMSIYPEPETRADARVAAPRHGAAYSRISFSYFLTGIKADTSGRSRTEAHDNNYLSDTRVTICSLSSGTPFRLPPSPSSPLPILHTALLWIYSFPSPGCSALRDRSDLRNDGNRIVSFVNRDFFEEVFFVGVGKRRSFRSDEPKFKSHD